MAVHAVIPAHNEMERIAACVRSLLTQTHKVDKITVVCDNCSDETPLIAYEMGAEVFVTSGNKHKKAGALNQFFNTLDDDDRFMFVVDADCEVSPGFVENALKYPDAAIGGIFVADGENGLIGALQGLEYIRYAREIARRQGKAKVLTGTSTFVRLSTLKKVAGLRGKTLPGIGGEVYNTLSITEDFELTLALKTIGVETLSPKACVVVTETMPNVTQLWNQRVRWQRGAVDTIKLFKKHRSVIPYVGQQLMMLVGIIMLFMLWSISGYLIIQGHTGMSIFWLGLGMIFYIERIVSAGKGTIFHKVLALTAVFDFIFDMFIAVVNIWVWISVLCRREAKWGIATIDRG